jgi:hypothetical protein
VVGAVRVAEAVVEQVVKVDDLRMGLAGSSSHPDGHLVTYAEPGVIVVVVVVVVVVVAAAAAVAVGPFAVLVLIVLAAVESVLTSGPCNAAPIPRSGLVDCLHPYQQILEAPSQEVYHPVVTPVTCSARSSSGLVALSLASSFLLPVSCGLLRLLQTTSSSSNQDDLVPAIAMAVQVVRPVLPP